MLTQGIVQRVLRWWWLALAIPVGIGLARLHFDVDILDLLPRDLATVQGLKLYEGHFTNARELIITVRTSEPEQSERLATELASRLRAETNLISSASGQPPWMEDPAQIGEFVAYLWFNQPPEVFSALTNRLAVTNLHQVLAETKSELASSFSPLDIAKRSFDPYDLLSVPVLTNLAGFTIEQGQKMFSSGNGAFRVIFVQALPELRDYQACLDWLKAVRGVVEEYQHRRSEYQGAVIRYTGRPAFVSDIAGSMRSDLTGSIIGTALIIAVLFWLMHRRWFPMLWLLLLLGVILVATLGIGSLILGRISVVSMGFAAVLLGLAVDYAVVHYQEALSHPELSVPDVRRAIAPSIIWAAVTTSSAFLVLNLGGLPGLAQLGTLVAIGVGLAALVMVVSYLPPLFPERRRLGSGKTATSWRVYFFPMDDTRPPVTSKAQSASVSSALSVTVLVVFCAAAILAFKQPKLDSSSNALRPQHAEAQEALDEMTSIMGVPRDALWLVATATNEAQMYTRLSATEAVIQSAVSNRVLDRFLIPLPFWPRSEFQELNRGTADDLSKLAPLMRAKAIEAGFNTNALVLAEKFTETWKRAGSSKGVFWPTNSMSQWLLNRFVAHSPGNWFALGLAYPATNGVAAPILSELSTRLKTSQVWLSSWDLLGTTTLERVREKFWLVLLPMIVLVLVSLWMAFRRWAEILLGVSCLGLGVGCLLSIMVLAGWSWNLLNLMALPLMLGTGVDYSIFMQLALRRNGGDLSQARRSIGRALLLCGGTAVAGFGSLGWSANAGMASLGKVCAVGIAANVLISVFLLPAWWCRWRATSVGTAVTDVEAPSVLYRLWLWRLGLLIGSVIPGAILRRVCLGVAELYYWCDSRRRQVVVQNLLPVVNHDLDSARQAAHRLFRQFGQKMADLWRYESGRQIEMRMAESGWETVEAARRRGQGVLLVSPHLGNWEIGAPLLVKRGIPFLVITQEEPGQDFTELRKASRQKWGVETLVVGNDAFAFVEVIKRLQEGAMVALLIDRPPPPTGVRVELFGKPFLASISAAELARATGCALVGVTVVRSGEGYLAAILPEIKYDRRALGKREARIQLTQDILRALEPSIRQNPDQWFHFVPVWPKES